MSGALTALSAVSGIAAQALPQVLTGGLGQQLAFLRQPRQIGPATDAPPASSKWSPAPAGVVVPDVTIEENFDDRLTVTQHPVATGTPLNDHAFRQPRTLTMRLGFTNANPVGALVGGVMSGLSGGADVGDALLSGGKGLLGTIDESRAKTMYETIRALQFNEKVERGKSPVVPMQVTTGKRTYPAMVITELTVRNDAKTEYALIIDVHFQEVLMATASVSQQPSQGNQAMPQKTDGTANGGTKNPTGPVSSVLNSPFFDPLFGPHTTVPSNP